MSLAAFLIAAVLLAVTPGPGIACAAARTARARWLSRLSGGTMIGLGAYLALARREA